MRSGDAASMAKGSKALQLNALSIERMLVLTRYWLNNRDALDAFAAHEMGPPLRNQIAKVYEDLSQLQKHRHDAKTLLAELRSLILELDSKHDRFARGLHCHLSALAETASDPADAAWFSDIRARLFPLGMSIVNCSYADEAGMATQIEQLLTPEIMDRLAAIRVGEHTLADLCRGWLDAGIELGERVIERDRLQRATGSASASADAPVLGVRPVRTRWMHAVNTMLSAMNLMELPGKQRNALIEPLERMVAHALRERASKSGQASGGPASDAPDSDDMAGSDDMDVAVHMQALTEARKPTGTMNWAEDAARGSHMHASNSRSAIRLRAPAPG